MDDAPSTFAGLLGVPATSSDDIVIATNGPTTFTDTSGVLNFGTTSAIDIRNNMNGAPTTFAGLIGLDADPGYNIYIETNGATTFTDTSDTINVNGSILAYNYGTLAGAHTTMDGSMASGRQRRHLQRPVAGEQAAEHRRQHPGAEQRVPVQRRRVGGQHDDGFRRRHGEQQTSTSRTSARRAAC